MANPFLGEIRMFAGNFAPQGWAYCDGQLLSISQNDALFALLGTTYGGDGVNTFALPDMRGRLPAHQGQGSGLTPRTMGERAGEQTHTLLAAEMPSHRHAMSATSDAANPASAPDGNVVANTGATFLYSNAGPDATMAPQAIGASGGNQPHNNMAPYLCVGFIIALQGIFPSRN